MWVLNVLSQGNSTLFNYNYYLILLLTINNKLLLLK